MPDSGPPSEELRIPAQQISGTTALVTGASRRFSRAIAVALSEAGADVVGVARDRARLEDLRRQLGGSFIPVVADAADPVVAGQLLDAYRPRALVLGAGASPLSRPLHKHTWQTFSRNWEVDVQQVFHWTREALLSPLDPGSVVVAFSSGAALRGSPLSGGYAGAKATIRFVSSYAAAESAREALGIRFISVLPQLTPATDLGAAAVAAYAARQRVDIPAYLEGLGPALAPEQVGKALVELVIDPGHDRDAYLQFDDQHHRVDQRQRPSQRGRDVPGHAGRSHEHADTHAEPDTHRHAHENTESESDADALAEPHVRHRRRHCGLHGDLQQAEPVGRRVRCQRDRGQHRRHQHQRMVARFHIPG